MVKQIGGDPDSALEYMQEFAAGDVIFQQGDAGDEMFIVQDGQVEIVYRESPDVDEEQLAVLELGDFFGEMAVLEGEPRTATARAVSQCRVLPVRGATFTKMLQSNPEIAVRMMRKLCSRLRHMEGRMREKLDAGLREAVSEAPPPPAAPPPRLTEPMKKTGSSSPVLLHEASGTRFEVSGSAETITVGRPDSAAGTVPDIDLTELNQERTVSRRHAKILRQGGRLFVVEETGTMNGTFVNGQRIEAGKLVEFKLGDELGFGAVKLDYRAS